MIGISTQNLFTTTIFYLRKHSFKKEISYLPLSKSLSCGPFGAPPYTHTFLILEDLPNSLATSCTCCASSLVGTNTRTQKSVQIHRSRYANLYPRTKKYCFLYSYRLYNLKVFIAIIWTTIVTSQNLVLYNKDQNHIWATRYCQKTGSNWPKFKYLGSTNIFQYTSYFPCTRLSKYDSTFISRLRNQTRFTEDTSQDNLS